MNTINKSRMLALLVTLMLALSLAACGGSDPVDDLLKDYETFVVKCEDLAKKDNISMDEAQKFLQDAVEFSQKAQKNFSADTKMSDAQTKRYTDLSNRLMQAVQIIQTKQ
ncbi:hypothetical protein LJC48_06550 [Desulfovibrio sp. OttesenSCG-928-C06]|nr:hypothetical protein [Desulfovibrio sp. OttesenSCG-928-C06]